MKKIYICHTEYHVLIALMKKFKDKNCEKSDIVLYGTLNNIHKIHKNIKKLNLFENIYVYNYKDREEIEKIPKTRNIILRRKKLKNYIKSNYCFDFLENKEIYMFNDNSIVGIYLRMMKIAYNLIEDGLDCYKSIQKHYNFRSLKYRIKILLQDVTCSFGSSKCVKQIEVNSKEGIFVFFKDKLIEVPRKQLFLNLLNEQKEEIIGVFLDEKIQFDKQDFSLIITQPLYKDGLLESEQQQINMYQYMINNYATKQVFIKPHPADEINYKKYIKDVKILPRDFPIELLNFMTNVSISKAITVFSTSINQLENCKEKIVLGYDWIKKYKVGERNGE